MNLKPIAFTLLLISALLGWFTMHELHAQAIPDEPVVILGEQVKTSGFDIKAFAEKIIIGIAALGTVLTALSAFVILLFGKIKEMKAAHEAMNQRQDRQTGIITETQKAIVDVALKTPPPTTSTDNSVHITGTVPLVALLSAIALSGCVTGEVCYTDDKGREVCALGSNKGIGGSVEIPNGKEVVRAEMLFNFPWLATPKAK